MAIKRIRAGFGCNSQGFVHCFSTLTNLLPYIYRYISHPFHKSWLQRKGQDTQRAGGITWQQEITIIRRLPTQVVRNTTALRCRNAFTSNPNRICNWFCWINVDVVAASFRFQIGFVCKIALVCVAMTKLDEDRFVTVCYFYITDNKI